MTYHPLDSNIEYCAECGKLINDRLRFELCEKCEARIEMEDELAAQELSEDLNE